MANLNLQTESLASISTNETTLQPGFILFVAFVLFGLILSVILQKITACETQPVAVPKKLIQHSYKTKLA
jgi:type III secretory pathway component EscR